jgi:hypothetical protein
MLRAKENGKHLKLRSKDNIIAQVLGKNFEVTF